MASKKKKAAKAVSGAAEAAVEADAAVAVAAKPYARTAPMRAVAWLSEIGDQPQMRILCGAVIGAGLVRGDARLVRAGAKMLAAHSLATGAKNAVKHRIDRTRPHAHNGGSGHKPRPGNNRAKQETSFPSGHSAGAAAVAHAFAGEYPEHRAAAYAAAGAVAIAQIPRCAHYPSDVGAGLALGVASASLVGPPLFPTQPTWIRPRASL
jgi:membrane-associated phospholipid phosphatase